MYCNNKSKQEKQFQSVYLYELSLGRKAAENDQILQGMKKSWMRQDHLAYQQYVKTCQTHSKSLIFGPVVGAHAKGGNTELVKDELRLKRKKRHCVVQ